MRIVKLAYYKIKDFWLLKKYKKFNIPIKKNDFWYIKCEDFITKKEFIHQTHLLDALCSYSEKSLVYYYCFGNLEKLRKEHNVEHEHYFMYVVEDLYNYPETFYIQKNDKSYYTKRQLELLKGIQKKLLEDGLKDIGTFYLNDNNIIKIKYNYDELRKRNIKKVEGYKLKKHEKLSKKNII